MSEQHSFIFKIPAIRTLVEKRTTMLGANRSTEDEPHLVDRLSMTKGEGFLFDDFLEEAVSETYNWIRAFGRNVRKAYAIYPNGELHTVKKNNGVYIDMDGENHGLSFSNGAVVNTVQDSGLIETIQATIPDIHIRIGDAEQVRCRIYLRFTTGVAGTPIADSMRELVNASTDTITEDTNIGGVYQFGYMKMNDDFGQHVIKSVDGFDIELDEITPRHITLSKGDYIVYQDGETRKYGILAADYDSLSDSGLIIAEETDVDVRDSIIFRVELPDWQDRNMLPAVQNHLQEAIVNYIIWRWFETVNPREADIYHDKWEAKAHEAQLGLNAEKHVLQRKSTWL